MRVPSRPLIRTDRPYSGSSQRFLIDISVSYQPCESGPWKNDHSPYGPSAFRRSARSLRVQTNAMMPGMATSTAHPKFSQSTNSFTPASIPAFGQWSTNPIIAEGLQI